MAEARSTFGPVVLLGLASAGLAALAGGKPWVTGSSGDIDTDVDSGSAMASTLSLDGVRESPLAAALALVVLACWGVLLVTRGRFRLAVAWLALLSATALLVITIEAFWSLPAKLTDALFEASGTDTATATVTAWYVVAVVAALLCVATSLAAVRLVRGWPEMGSKYDAPTGGSGTDDAPPETNIDIWKALDEGRDPTA